MGDGWSLRRNSSRSRTKIRVRLPTLRAGNRFAAMKFWTERDERESISAASRKLTASLSFPFMRQPSRMRVNPIKQGMEVRDWACHFFTLGCQQE
jgi:hypothetical protein